VEINPNIFRDTTSGDRRQGPGGRREDARQAMGTYFRAQGRSGSRSAAIAG